MADPDTLQNLRCLHNMYTKEHQKLVNCLPKMAQKISDQTNVAIIAAGSSDPVEMPVYDLAVECITTSTSVLRKLNMYVATLLDQYQHDPAVAIEAAPLASKTDALTGGNIAPLASENGLLASKTAPCKLQLPSCQDAALPVASNGATNFKKWCEPDYSFYLKKYRIGYTSVAILTHIASALGSSVYLFDVNAGSHVGVAPNMTECQQLARPPPIGCVFGVHLDDDSLFRVVRAFGPLQEPSAVDTTIAAYLLDTGETVNIEVGTKTSPRLFALSEQQQNVPAQAIPCRVVQLQHVPMGSVASEFVEKHLYQKVRFEVAEIHTDHTIDVKLSPMSYHPPIKPNNPFYDMISQQHQQPTATLPSTGDVLPSWPLYNRSQHVEKPPAINKYAPSVVTQQIVAQKWPKIGDTVRCVPTHITQVNTFFGQIVHPFVPAELQLGELTRCMNSAVALAAARRFDRRPPNVNDLVLALFRDRQWHRARVLDVVEESVGVHITDVRLDVFFVDYGNCYQVRLDDVRQWEERFSHVPFQAYEFRIGNVDRLHEQADILSIGVVRDMILYKTLTAQVHQNDSVLVVTLQDSHGFDIGMKMCANNLAKPPKPRHF